MGLKQPYQRFQPAPVALGGDLNSIFDGRMYGIQWDKIFPSNVVRKTPNYVEYVGVDGLTRADGCRLNRQQNESAGDKLAMWWTAPPGCTSATWFAELEYPATLSGQTVVFGLYAIDGTTLIAGSANTVAVLSATMALFSATATGLTPGTEYRAVFHIHNTGLGTNSNATCVVGRNWLQPGGTLVAPFDADFLRFPLDASLAHDSHYSSVASRKLGVAGYARYVFETRGTAFSLEYNRVYTFSTIDPAIIVNGKHVGTIPLAGSNAINHVAFTLPPGQKTVEIVCPPENNSVAPPGAPNITTGYLHALYAYRNSGTMMIPPTEQATRRLMIYGDSMICGFGCVRTTRHGLVAILRELKYPGRVLNEAWGSRSLAEDCGSGGLPVTYDAAKTKIFVDKIKRANPSEFWSGIGTNDYGGAYWNGVAEFSTAHQAFLTQLTTALPNCRVFVQTPLPRNSEVANGRGWTMAQLRTQMATDVTALTGAGKDVVLVDGTTILTFSASGVNSQYFDTVHPNENGMTQWAEAVRSTLVTANSGW